MEGHDSSGESAKFGTDCVHAEYKFDPQTGALMPPISLSTTFKQNYPGIPFSEYEYSRSGNPTRDVLEKAVAKLEKGNFGLAFASGCMAMTTIAHLIGYNGHVVMINDVYGGTNRFFSKVAPNYGLKLTLVNMTEPKELYAVVTESTKLIWIETPTNPTLQIVDIKAISSLVHEISKDIIVVVDNTFLSPIFQTPLDLGADIVMHSMTKYLNGHCDVVMGIAVLKDKTLRDRLAYYQNALGGIPSPFDCYMVLRGIRTLHLRMERHGQNAMRVARYLESKPHVAKVIYSGLESHPQHELAKRQQRGFGGMISMVLKGSQEDAVRFAQLTKLFTLAESLGGVESLIEIPSIMTHGSVSLEERTHLGITDSFIRLSIGLEYVEDLIADLEQAFQIVFSQQYIVDY